MSRDARGPAIALPPDSDVEEAFHALVSAAVDQPRPSPELAQCLNRVLTLIGHPVAVGKSVQLNTPHASTRSAA